MITDYVFNKTNSPDAKQNFKFLDEVQFDIHPKSKNSRDKNLMKNFYHKRALLESGVQEVFFLSENPNDLCNLRRLKFQGKQAGKHNTRFDNEMVAIIDKLLEYKCFTPTQHKKLLKILIL